MQKTTLKYIIPNKIRYKRDILQIYRNKLRIKYVLYPLFTTFVSVRANAPLKLFTIPNISTNMNRTLFSLSGLIAAIALAATPLTSLAKEDIAPVLPSEEQLQRPFGAHDSKAFRSPEKVYYPQTWFHYIGGNVSLEGITVDLEAIAEAGISGVQLFHGQFGGKWPATGESIECLSEKWDDAVRHTANECRRLGLRFTMQNCPGWAMSGGPWIKPENAMRTLIYSRTYAKGKEIKTTLRQPQPSNEEWRDYRDIAVVAFPRAKGDTGRSIPVAEVKGSGDFDWQEMFKTNKRVTLPPTTPQSPHWIEVRFSSAEVIRSIQLPTVQALNHAMCYEPGVHITAFALLPNGTQRKIIDADLPQSSWQDKRSITFACPEVGKSIGCRIEIRNAYRAYMTKMYFHPSAQKNSWESEAGWTLRDFERTADDIRQDAATYISSNKVVDITEYMASDGTLTWTAPDSGEWTIMRIGHVNEGKRNGPAPASGTGWECDKLSTEGPEAHFAGYIGRIAKDVLPQGMMNGLLLDSWECNTQMWTMKMEQEFKERRGYELRRWMPALFGYVIDDPETTSCFLLDWRRVVGDLFANKFFRRMAELGHENGLDVIYETAAGDTFPADIMEYFKHADVPMCEFWHPYSTGYVGSLNFKPIKPTASAARLYGKPRVAAESFTSFSLTWDEDFEMLKDYADYHFIEGVTHNVFHTYTHNPQIDFLPPGSAMSHNIGTPFLRGQTWWKYMREFTTYLARCSYMLERGKPHSDVLWYLGDEVSHKPDQEYPFPAGYKYDYCNPDVLLNRIEVRDGVITTPEGLTYKLLWIPENKRILPATLERIHSLLEQGATVVANAPLRIATLEGGKDSQQRFNKAVDAIWGKARKGQITTIGKGRLLSGVSIDKALEMLEMEQDVRGDIRWLHRKTKGADWYFITPQKSSSFAGEVSFHAEGAAELWDPVTGETTPLNVVRRNGYAVAHIEIPKAGSYFVVFNHKGKQKSAEEPAYSKTKAIDGEWSVHYPEGWGAPAELRTDKLMPLCEMPLSAEGKAFSGCVTYTTEFNVDKKHKHLLLDLGEVDMIAEVSVNGKSLRPMWCQPYTADIAHLVKPGRNTLQIKVTTTWFNRLAYDAALPEPERKTWTFGHPSPDSALRKSGLMGPVVLKY